MKKIIKVYNDVNVEYTTVKELINKLAKFPKDLPIIITNGFDCDSFFGEFEVHHFIDPDERFDCVEIGIGGCIQNNLEQVLISLKKERDENNE